MDTEVVEETMGSNDQGHFVKRKRTKRQRPASPLDVAMASSSSSIRSGGAGGGGQVERSSSPIPTSTTSSEFSENTEEEEDMANCLILLAQGHNGFNSKRVEEINIGIGGFERVNGRRITDTAAMESSSKAAGLYVYECKTCNRCFPSFQALGGHRASHKKPKSTATTCSNVVEDHQMKAGLVNLQDQDESASPPHHHHHHHHHRHVQMGIRSSANNSGGTSSNRSKVHECSICGSEFSSGQALGGHMRRHRTSVANSSTINISTATTTINSTTTPMMITSDPDHKKPNNKRPRNVLALDLNLPAPEEDRDSKLSFTSKQQPLVFSASALVDCHY